MASKFDNRLKEFGERWEVDKYLSATGYLPPNVRPFFVALPKVRPCTNKESDRHEPASQYLCAKRQPALSPQTGMKHLCPAAV